MHIEELTKSQIVLLTLLVSFVTSIATGIVTVALMDQAPPTVTQNINRIVERTVEKVVPTSQAASVVTQEKMVIVKEADLITKAVDRTTPSVIGVYSTGDDGKAFQARGVVVANRIIATDATFLLPDHLYKIELSDGTDVPAHILNTNTLGVGLLKTDDASTTLSGITANLSTDQIQLGQTLIAISGKDGLSVAEGIVTSLGKQGTTTPKFGPTKPFYASISGATAGSPVINTDGAVVGIVVGTDGTIAPVHDILDLLHPTSATSTPE